MKKSSVTTVIREPEITISEYGFYPDSPIIINKFSNTSLTKIRGDQQGWVKHKKSPKDVRRCYEEGTYYHPAGGYGIPAIAIKQCLVNACRFTDGLPMVMMRGSIFVMHDNDPVTQLVKLEGVRYCREDVVRLGIGGTDLHYRPTFWPWKITVRIKHDVNVLPCDQLTSLITKAGIHVGLGDWRMLGKSGTGPFGAFHPGNAADEKAYQSEFKRMTAKIKAEGEIPAEYYTDPNAKAA